MNKSPIRVLHILNELRFSGAELMLFSAADQLGAQSSTVLATGTVPGVFAPSLQTAGYCIKHIPFAKSLRFFLKIRKLVKSGDFDIVHIHSERASVAYSLVAASCGIRTVRSIHNEFLFTGVLRLKRTLDRALQRRVGVEFVSCSRRVQRNEMVRFRHKTIVIDNWIDPRRVDVASEDSRTECREALGFKATDFVSISIANEAPAKNLYELFEAIAILPANFKHLHIGETSAVLKEKSAAPASNKVFHLGLRNDIGSLLAAADAFVCSSTFEGGPLVLMEAAAVGLPCVTTLVGVAEEFANTPGVFIVNPDRSSIAGGIQKASKMTVDEVRVAHFALKDLAAKRFVPDVGANKYKALYEGLRRF